VEALPRLSAELGGPTILVKRDDLTGLAFGGNKTRKLEFLMAEAQANGARTVITAGAVQSNHCRQTAAACARLNAKCILVLSGDKPPTISGNLLLDRLFDAEVVWTTFDERDQVLQVTFRVAWQAGKRPYLIPYGGSNATGASAYVYALKELIDQGYQPDWILFPSSSGGTQAGLAAGAKLFGFIGKVLGISVDETKADLTAHAAELASATTDLLSEKIQFTSQDILVNDDYVGEGYGIMGRPEIEAIQLFARTEGLVLDPVYTGRAAAGMIDLVRKGTFAHPETVLFWHTGGAPAIFSEKYANIVDSI
jgi:D-cysteine desulfhydrase family pyridoxal phosphate-dependent enzyme